MMTNNHVLPDAAFAKTKTKAQFNYQYDLNRDLLPHDEFDFDPDAGFYTNAELDFTVDEWSSH